jgi:hypothetical protein
VGFLPWLDAECYSRGFRILTYKQHPLKAKPFTVHQIGNHEGYKVQFRVRPAAVYLGRNNRIFRSERSVLKPLQHPHILILTILRRRLTKKYAQEKKRIFTMIIIYYPRILKVLWLWGS